MVGPNHTLETQSKPGIVPSLRLTKSLKFYPRETHENVHIHSLQGKREDYSPTKEVRIGVYAPYLFGPCLKLIYFKFIL